MITLEAGPYRLELEPERGGSIIRFDWHGRPLMRSACGPSILDVASFPLVPFSNRIAGGRFTFDGRHVVLEPNFPAIDAANPLHGMGWLSPWTCHCAGPESAVLEHRHAAGGWPWSYLARQAFALSGDGLVIELAVTNTGSEPMPLGLGFHPWFPRDADTVYHSLHRAEWLAGPDCLPQARQDAGEPVDWWQGAPVASRTLDTVYEGRHGPLEIAWPARGYRLTMTPSDALGCTVVYVPAGEDFFCVEPVSHVSNSFNHASPGFNHGVVAPGETVRVSLALAAQEL